jgi:hypothetical protein
VIGFFGIHSILIKNLILYPVLGSNDLINIFGFKIEVSDIIMNLVDMLWGMIVWSSGKRILLP